MSWDKLWGACCSPQRSPPKLKTVKLGLTFEIIDAMMSIPPLRLYELLMKPMSIDRAVSSRPTG